jgi:hypothetical protein
MLLDAYLAYEPTQGNTPPESHFSRGHALEAGIRETPPNVMADAVLIRAQHATDFQTTRKLLRLLSMVPISQVSEDRKKSLRSLVYGADAQKPEDLQARGWFRCELVEILGQVGLPSDAKIIETWIHDDLQRMRDEQNQQQAKYVEWQANGRRLPRPVMVAVCAFWNQYQRALVRIGGPDAGDVFTRLLEKADLLNFSGWGLYLLTNQGREECNSPFGRRPDYVGVHRRQQALAVGAALDPDAKRYRDAIFKAIEHFLSDLEKPESKVSKNEIIGAAASLAALNDSRAIPFLLKFASDKHVRSTIVNALHNLALNGTILPSETVAPILEPFILENDKPTWESNNDNWHMVVRAIAVLLFSDDPRLGLERIRQMSGARLKSHSAEDLLILLGACPLAEAVDLIIELALKPEIDESYFFAVATVLSESPSPSAERGLASLLEKLCSGALSSPHALGHLPRMIGRIAKKNRLIWDSIRQRCAKPHSQFERHILICILGEVGSYEAGMCLCDLLSDGLPMNFQTADIIKGAVTGKIPAGGSAYYLEPREATQLKKRLINIAYADPNRQSLAMQFLGVILRCRLEHGWPANEPLHPDVELLNRIGIPWELL